MDYRNEPARADAMRHTEGWEWQKCKLTNEPVRFNAAFPTFYTRPSQPPAHFLGVYSIPYRETADRNASAHFINIPKIADALILKTPLVPQMFSA